MPQGLRHARRGQARHTSAASLLHPGLIGYGVVMVTTSFATLESRYTPALTRIPDASSGIKITAICLRPGNERRQQNKLHIGSLTRCRLLRSNYRLAFRSTLKLFSPVTSSILLSSPSRSLNFCQAWIPNTVRAVSETCHFLLFLRPKASVIGFLQPVSLAVTNNLLDVQQILIRGGR